MRDLYRVRKVASPELGLYLDTEFTELSQKGELLSLALFNPEGVSFYGEVLDYDPRNISEWVQTNVMRYMEHQGGEKVRAFQDERIVKVIGSYAEVQNALKKYIKQVRGNRKVKIISDCLAYDWMHFAELFGGGLEISNYGVNYIPKDICTMFEDAGIDPDISREKYAAVRASAATFKHNAYWDAYLIYLCEQKLLSEF